MQRLHCNSSSNNGGYVLSTTAQSVFLMPGEKRSAAQFLQTRSAEEKDTAPRRSVKLVR